MIKALFLVIILCLAVGCQREPTKSDLGPQVSEGAIRALQNSYLSELDPYSVTSGQKVHTAQTQEIFSSQSPFKSSSKEWTTEVVDVENFPERREITTVRKVSDKILDPDFVYEFKNVFKLPQLESFEVFEKMESEANSTNELIQATAKQLSTEENQVEGIAFHNLQTRIVSLVPPKKVADSPSCAGIPDCRIQANLITYDVIFLMTNGETQKSEFEWFASSEVPFFASILKQCASSLIPIDEVRVYVKQCTEVVDFTP